MVTDSQHRSPPEVPTQKHTGLDAGENRIDRRPSPSPAPKKHLLEKLGASVSAAQHPQTPEAMTLARYLDIPSPNFTFCFLSWCLPLPTIHYCSKSKSQQMGTEAQCPWKDDKEGKGSLKPPTKTKILAFQREEKPCWGTRQVTGDISQGLAGWHVCSHLHESGDLLETAEEGYDGVTHRWENSGAPSLHQ